MMLIKVSGAHLNTDYKDCTEAGYTQKTHLNPFEKKYFVLRFAEIWFYVVKWLCFGVTTKQTKPMRKQNYLWNSLALKVQFRKTRKNDASNFIFRCYYFYVLSFKIIIFKTLVTKFSFTNLYSILCFAVLFWVQMEQQLWNKFQKFILVRSKNTPTYAL